MNDVILEHDIEAFEAMTSLDFKFCKYGMKIQEGKFSHLIVEEGTEVLLGLRT